MNFVQEKPNAHEFTDIQQKKGPSNKKETNTLG